MKAQDNLIIAKDVFREEAAAIQNLTNLLTEDFSHSVSEILDCDGRVIITGLGKSGIIAKKISATFASTGTPSLFMHPTEAYHGDLGMIKNSDIIIAISNSGETDEILKLIPVFKQNRNKIISITGNPQSKLSEYADYNLNIHVNKEVCPLNLAPTASTIATMAMGDALAIALMGKRKFKKEDFAKFHPGGSLGKRLLTKAEDVMRTDNLPLVRPDIVLSELIIEISKARLGIAVVVQNNIVQGVITDGDIRRHMEIDKNNLFSTTAKEIMNSDPKFAHPKMGLIEVENLMIKHKIHCILVLDNDRIQGIVEHFNIY